jgi:hypothetical protein
LRLEGGYVLLHGDGHHSPSTQSAAAESGGPPPPPIQSAPSMPRQGPAPLPPRHHQSAHGGDRPSAEAPKP